MVITAIDIMVTTGITDMVAIGATAEAEEVTVVGMAVVAITVGVPATHITIGLIQQLAAPEPAQRRRVSVVRVAEISTAALRCAAGALAAACAPRRRAVVFEAADLAGAAGCAGVEEAVDSVAAVDVAVKWAFRQAGLESTA